MKVYKRAPEIAVWKSLCGLAVKLCGSQAKFKVEANILKRLTKQFGSEETERFLRGALLLHWNSLTSLGSSDGLGRRWALASYWQHENRRGKQVPEQLKSILQQMAQP